MNVGAAVIAIATLLQASQDFRIIPKLSRATLGEIGIAPITATTLQEAIDLGHDDTPPVADYSEPIAIFVKAHTLEAIKQKAVLMERMSSYTKAPFGLSIISPYVYAMFYSADAKRRFRPVPALNPISLNANKVIVHVSLAAI